MAKKKQSQVTVDEAVAAKGGKPGFVQQLEDATGVTAQREKEREAEEHFDRRVVTVERRTLPLRLLFPMKHNPRAEVGDVSALVTSIERNGFIGALSVRETGEAEETGEMTYEVWAGNRRLKAAQVAGLDEVPCDVYELTEVQALELNLTEQINRSDLTPLEEGEACRRLIELSGYSVQQVADKLGQSSSWVRGRLALCGLAGEVKKELAKGELSLTVATALAALPTQKMQVQGLERVRYSSNAGVATSVLREQFCRPLKGAPWKLTDADLVPEAGACSKCPHNSANVAAPGLFDNVKAPPTCSNLPCYEGKAKAAWERATAKAKAAGAKVLPISEGHKLFAHGQLGYGSRYVEAGEVAHDDRSKRTWRQLVAEMDAETAPLLHIAQDREGAPRELYVRDEALKACAEELGLKWAKKAIEKPDASGGGEGPSEWEVQKKERERRNAVGEEIARSLSDRVAVQGLTLPIVRALAASYEDSVAEFLTAHGAPDTSPKACEKFLASSVADELLSFVTWRCVVMLSHYEGFDPVLVELAKAEGFDLKKMYQARIDGEKAEAAKEKAA